MSYSRRGSSCRPQTIACTTSQKYLPPNAAIYKQWGMYMYRFPETSVQQPLHPTSLGHSDIIQNYYGKIYDHSSASGKDDTIHISHGHDQDPAKQYTKPSCKNC